MMDINDLYILAEETLSDAILIADVRYDGDLMEPKAFAAFLAIMTCEYLEQRTKEEELTEEDRRSIHSSIMMVANQLYDAYEEDRVSDQN